MSKSRNILTMVSILRGIFFHLLGTFISWTSGSKNNLFKSQIIWGKSLLGKATFTEEL